MTCSKEFVAAIREVSNKVTCDGLVRCGAVLFCFFSLFFLFFVCIVKALPDPPKTVSFDWSANRQFNQVLSLYNAKRIDVMANIEMLTYAKNVPDGQMREELEVLMDQYQNITNARFKYLIENVLQPEIDWLQAALEKTTPELAKLRRSKPFFSKLWPF